MGGVVMINMVKIIKELVDELNVEGVIVDEKYNEVIIDDLVFDVEDAKITKEGVELWDEEFKINAYIFPNGEVRYDDINL